MIYRFEDFELDTAKFELRREGRALAAEPQVLALLQLLVERRDRLLTRDEIVERVWDGRIVSDSAISSRIKSLRQLLGDDGAQQRLIRTVHGRGFRFVGTVEMSSALIVGAAWAEPGGEIDGAPVSPVAPRSRPSIAVLPFHLVGIAGPHAPIADALPHELISELSRLRWLFVIARGSSFRFRNVDLDVRTLGSALGVRYALSGTVEIAGSRMAITVELAETAGGGVIWAERFSSTVDAVHDIRGRIVSSVVSALEIRIPMAEAQLARLSSPENLDAWAAYHLGLDYMFRFTEESNAAAEALFERSVAQEPGFARAHAGLSFTNFQRTLLQYGGDPDSGVVAARRHAEAAIERDPMDPFANFTMGRSLWIAGDLEGSLGWLERATTVSPNYAQGLYTRALTRTLLGDGDEGREHIDLALSLSPLDPLLYAMLCTRAFSHLVKGEDEEAEAWAIRGVRVPNAHALIPMIAAAVFELTGKQAEALHWAGKAREMRPDFTQRDFFRSFPFEDPVTRKRISDALARLSF